MFAVSIIGTLPAQAAEQADLLSGAKPAHAKVLDFAGLLLGEVVKRSIGAKCDQLAADPNDLQKIGAPVPIDQAIEVCKRAVEVSPLPQYQYQLGRALEKAGKYANALHWYRKAADQGYAMAQISIGSMYDHGRGVAQDYAEAMKWLRMAAEQGDGPVQNDVGNMYLKGTGVAQDYAEAMKWYRKAANQGIAMAQSNIGQMYVNGRGIKQDYAEARKWFQLAAAQGDEDAKHELDKLEEYAKLEAGFTKAAEAVTSSIVDVLKYDIENTAIEARQLGIALRGFAIYPQEYYGCSSLEHGTPVLTSGGTMSGGGFRGEGFNGRTLPAAIAQVEYLCVNRAQGTKEKGFF